MEICPSAFYQSLNGLSISILSQCVSLYCDNDVPLNFRVENSLDMHIVLRAAIRTTNKPGNLNIETEYLSNRVFIIFHYFYLVEVEQSGNFIYNECLITKPSLSLAMVMFNIGSFLHGVSLL